MPGRTRNAGIFETWTELSQTFDPALRSSLVRAVKGSAMKDGWPKITSVEAQYVNTHGKDYETHGYKNLSDMLKDAGTFEIKKGQNGTCDRVRVKAMTSPGKVVKVDPA